MIKPEIFIHIPKNGGMTIRHSPQLKNKIVVAGQNTHVNKTYTQELHAKMKSLGDHHGNEHTPWRYINEGITSTFRAFAIARNPWDRVVSRYFFAKKVIEVEKKVPASYADVSSFEAFLEERHKWGSSKYMWHRAVRGWYPTAFHVTNKYGELKCDMLSFENYNAEVCAYFGIPEMSRARNVTALNKGTYQSVYTPKTIQIIADWYKDDINMFGYDFDSGPTKNTWTTLNDNT
jgi:hypothetical protein